MNGADVALAAIVLGTASVTVLSLARMVFRRLETRDRALSGRSAGNVDDRLARIEQAVDAIAIEVERMSEGQRFTTKLLAERLNDPANVPQSRDLLDGRSSSAR